MFGLELLLTVEEDRLDFLGGRGDSRLRGWLSQIWFSTFLAGSSRRANRLLWPKMDNDVKTSPPKSACIARRRCDATGNDCGATRGDRAISLPRGLSAV